MVQEFHVLRCFSCQTFQVHQVKKSKKWNCKMCGAKQSLLKVYGRGSGADCRRHVQKLNSLRGEIHEAEHAMFPWQAEGELVELQDEGDKPLSCEKPQQGVADTASRWSKYLSRTGEEAGPEEDTYMEQSACRGRNAGKRKRSWRFSPVSGRSACPERSKTDQSAVKDPWNIARQRTQCEAKRDLHFVTSAASKISHDATVPYRPPLAVEAPLLPKASRVKPAVGSSKWSRFLSARCEDGEDDGEEEAPRRHVYAGISSGRAGSEEALGFPSDPSPVPMGGFGDPGHFQEEVPVEVCLTDKVFVGNLERSPENEINSLKFSPGYQCIQKLASHKGGLSHLDSGLADHADPVCPRNLSISKPHLSLYSLFQTNEDFDDTI